VRIDTFLEQSPMFAVNRAARRFETLAGRVLADCNLGFLEALVLAALFFEAPREVKPSELAATFATTRGSVSHCVSSLEAKGLVQRSIDTEDARVFLLALKPQGRRFALRAIAALDKLQKAFEDEMGKAALGEMIRGLRRLDSLFLGSNGPADGPHR
jgi:DNA-binding MarR family transcriptional regulator